MASANISIKDALNYGWKAFTNQVGFFIGLVLVSALVFIVPDLIIQSIFGNTGVASFILKILLRIVAIFVVMVITRFSLDIYDRGAADTSRISSLFGLLLPYLGGRILAGLIVFLGLILLIIPGIFAAYVLYFVGYLIVDRGLGPITALKESHRVTDGNKLDLFLFSLALLVINILGMIPLGLGLFITIPVSIMATAYVYRQVSPAQSA